LIPPYPADASDYIQGMLEEQCSVPLKGTYRLASPIILHDCGLQGNMMNFGSQLIPDEGVDAFHIYREGQSAMRCALSDMVINCSNYNSDETAIRIEKAYQVDIERICLLELNANSVGFSIKDSNSINIHRPVIYGRYGCTGIHVMGGSTVYISNPDIERCYRGLIHEGDGTLEVSKIYAESNDLFVDHKSGNTHLYGGRIATGNGQAAAWIRADHFHNYGCTSIGPGRWSMYASNRPQDTDRVMFGVPDDQVDWWNQTP